MRIIVGYCLVYIVYKTVAYVSLSTAVSKQDLPRKTVASNYNSYAQINPNTSYLSYRIINSIACTQVFISRSTIRTWVLK